MTDSPIKITARWDQDQVPVGKRTTRGLLIEVEAKKPEQAATERPPVNVALVLDRSGSMTGEYMHCAIEAAAGVVAQLDERDRLSLVCYDHEVEVLTQGLCMDAEGRQRAEQALRGLSARGTTNLSGGWLQGARCVADVMEQEGFKAGHVILLTDGHANAGEVDPKKLAEISGDLAQRQVTSTCVGIGAGYSAVQIAAIAEAGQGELHQSSEPEEIIEVLAGEIGEQTMIVARNFSVHVKGMGMHRARQLTNYQRTPIDGRREYFIGNLIGGQKRRIALLVDFDPRIVEEPCHKRYTVSGLWLDVETALEQLRAAEHLELEFQHPEKFDPTKRNLDVAEEISQLWMARQGYDAMMLNDVGNYEAAVAAFDREDEVFGSMVEGLPEAAEMLSSREQFRDRSARHWDDIHKREAIALSRKRMRSKPEYREMHSQKSWNDLDTD